MRSATPRQSKSAPDSTRQRIIEAAEEFFARRGLRASSLKEITERAGVNIAAVNHHFQTKGAGAGGLRTELPAVERGASAPADGCQAGPSVRKKLEARTSITVRLAGNVPELRVVGKNEAATGYPVGLDCYRVTPQ